MSGWDERCKPSARVPREAQAQAAYPAKGKGRACAGGGSRGCRRRCGWSHPALVSSNPSTVCAEGVGRGW
eukprot:595588-Prorocentrum_minimum.AAC.1